MSDSPQPGSIWARIEEAREALGWNESEFGVKALKNRTGYTAIKRRGWSATERTIQKLISRLEQDGGYSGAWLRAGVLPEMADGSPLPERRKTTEQLIRLAGKLGLGHDQIMRLWVDLDSEGPLQRYPEDLQRAAFAAAYLENRTLEDVMLAVEKARASENWRTAPIDDMLMVIRVTLRTIKRGGSGTLLSIKQTKF